MWKLLSTEHISSLLDSFVDGFELVTLWEYSENRDLAFLVIMNVLPIWRTFSAQWIFKNCPWENKKLDFVNWWLGSQVDHESQFIAAEIVNALEPSVLWSIVLHFMFLIQLFLSTSLWKQMAIKCYWWLDRVNELVLVVQVFFTCLRANTILLSLFNAWLLQRHLKCLCC